MKPTRATYIPSHPEAFVVDFGSKEFDSFLKATKDFKAGETITPLVGLTKGPKRYTSVQCGPNDDDHVELNSDLVFVNHSCDPNAAFDMSSQDASQWMFRALKPVKRNEKLTFFYPSTEWDMDQSFECECQTKLCLRTIKGAKWLPTSVLEAQMYISPWIWSLIDERDRIVVK